MIMGVIKKALHTHQWEQATIRQLKIEDGKLIGFTIKTPLLLKCAKCGKTKRTFITNW